MPAKKSPDPFGEVRAQTLRHRAQHGCGAYPFADGSVLGVIAAAVAAKRVLELGCALGYTALWFAHGAKGATIDTIEFDPAHVRLARENFAAFGVANRVSMHQGDFAEVLPTLAPGYDLAFFDGFAPTPDYLRTFQKLVRPRGVLISSNLHFRDAETRAYRHFAVCRRCLAHCCDRRRRYRDERAALTATPSRLLSRLRPVKLRAIGEKTRCRSRPSCFRSSFRWRLPSCCCSGRAICAAICSRPPRSSRRTSPCGNRTGRRGWPRSAMHTRINSRCRFSSMC